MPVDADDFLNCNIAQWCIDNPDEHGAVSSDGYVWLEGTRRMTIYPQMHTFCGSCNIIKMYVVDLPEKMPAPDHLCHDGLTAGVLNSRYPIRFDHHLVVEKYKQMGKPFATLPFRSTIYLRGTGENISSIFHGEQSGAEQRRFHPIAFFRSLNPLRYKLVGKRIHQEFGIRT